LSTITNQAVALQWLIGVLAAGGATAAVLHAFGVF
jgi:hypothetical protein